MGRTAYLIRSACWALPRGRRQPIRCLPCSRTAPVLTCRSRFCSTSGSGKNGANKMATASGLPDPDLLFATEKEKTFQHQSSLPSLPVPDLEHTLNKYLESVKPHLTPEEYAQTEATVQEFGSGVGLILQKKLLDKAEHSRNWLEKWWLDLAYLDGRYPVAPLVNLAGVFPFMYHCYPGQEGTQIERAGMILYYTLKFWELIRKERLRAEKDNKGNQMCMSQFRNAFNTCRIPGVSRDKLLSYFCTDSEGTSPGHLSVLCGGRIFVFDAVDADGQILSAPEIQSQLQRIRDVCDSKPEGLGLGVLTSHERTTWAKIRNQLVALHPDNYSHLELIQSSIICVALDDNQPKDASEIFLEALAGNPVNRWYDKSNCYIIFKNGLGAANCDHAPCDGMMFVTLLHYTDLHIKRCKGEWQGSSEIRDHPPPVELEFTVNQDILDSIEQAKQVFHMSADNLFCITRNYTRYGKSFLRSKNLHPSTHVQMALQYTYYKMYKKPAPTYETATTRRFYHARTETLRSCTQEALEWSKAMLDPSVTDDKRLQLYLTAANKHNTLMEEATHLKGSDRHLMGLSCIAGEEGLPVPALYEDPAYTKSGGGGHFVLSTSSAGYTATSGAVAPMVEHGYGIFYRIQPDQIVPIITKWKSSPDTDAVAFCDSLFQSLNEMGDLLDKASSKL